MTSPVETCYDFHSLVWDSKDDAMWKRKATITRADFEEGRQYGWISDLHSMDSRYGSAIIRVAEGDARVSYSWRQWDLLSNKEIRTIRVCECPFESFDI